MDNNFVSMSLIILLVLISIIKANLETNRDIMKTFSYTFGLKMFECGEKTNYTQEMAKDILYFWDRPLDNVETGCLIICAMFKLQLLDSDGELMRLNAEGYVRSNGADDNMAEYLIERYNTCKRKTSSISNGCEIALEIAKCFRHGIRQKNWTPDTSSLFNIPHDK